MKRAARRPTLRWPPGAALCAGALLVGAAAVAQAPAQNLGAAAPLRFVALGDMPYDADLIAGPAYRQLIDLINDRQPRFSVHVGDFKSGTSRCTDAVNDEQAAYFQRFASALVYTPGDNDWLDCQRRGDDPLQRLQALRQRFFASARSLGQRPLAVQRQADLMPAHARYVENLRWQQQGVLFATFHTVGPRNGSDDPSAEVRQEARQREAANQAWIRAAFDVARSHGHHALVLATQADAMTSADPPLQRLGAIEPSFAQSIGRTLLPLAAAAPFPVLLVHGDSHHYKTDQPFVDEQGRSITNLWRLQVFGDPRLHAVQVDVAPPGPRQRHAPFSFSPIWNPLSPDPRRVVN